MKSIPMPWRVVGRTIQAGTLAERNHTFIAECGDDLDPDEAAEVARLIAQAPAMYEALRLCEVALRNYALGEGNSRAGAARAEAIDRARAILAAIDGA
jgi:hypothetical protein